MADTTIATAAGLLKPVMGKLQELLPEEALCQKLFPFSKGNRVGELFQEPLEVVGPWGFSFMGTAGTGLAGASALNAPTAITTVKAQITTYPVVLPVRVNSTLLNRGPDGDDALSFKGSAAFTVGSMTMAMRRQLEMGILAGQSGLFIVDSYSGNTTSGTVTLTAGSLRPGVLAILEGANLATVTGTTVRTNATGIPVTSVDVDAGTITVGAHTTSPVAGDSIYIFGANYGSDVYGEMVGLKKQISAQTGTVFAVNKATYQAYRGNVVTSFGPVTQGSIASKILAKAAGRGFSGKGVLLMSPASWGDLNSKVSNQQVFQQNPVGKATLGVSSADETVASITVRSNGIECECYSHPYQADGELTFVPKEYVVRIGAAFPRVTGKGESDISFDVPGAALKFMLPITGYDLIEFQCRIDQAIYNRRPAFSVQASGVTH